VGPRASLDGQKISSPLGFDPGQSSPLSVAIPTELPDPRSCPCPLYEVIRDEGGGEGTALLISNLRTRRRCAVILMSNCFTTKERAPDTH